ncbi:SH3 domain-containing protein [Ophiocordyceps camponoti-floridani]|uniref:SH3 domain-containing protein n=1 Tax=Ophiocordyceps camponoti-floridani TaxID=2030778 RepID=A0A8H4VHR3_9HYPO|nr:SH3 domain-containing protein [Ophiocordyceps camponoti-floridani]
MGGLNNPFPSSLRSECKKCGRILKSFVNPRQSLGPDRVIHPSVLSNAKGLAVFTVLRAGCLGSGRIGSGLVVARLPDGRWSAPSAAALVGGGFGGLIGAELTDFVFVLNDVNAVKTLAQAGSLALGGNVSLAAGPIGRSAEADAAASLKSFSGIYTYCKTKGLFAGISLEGSVIIERRDANESLYRTRYTAQQILTGSVEAPSEAQPLTDILNTRYFSGDHADAMHGNTMYNDEPVYATEHDDVVWEGRRGSGYGENTSRRRDTAAGAGAGEAAEPTTTAAAAATSTTTANSKHNSHQEYVYRDVPSTPTDPTPNKDTPPKRVTKHDTAKSSPAPTKADMANLGKDEAIAIFTFDPAQPGDLGFKRGDVIKVTKRTDSDNDWWTGMIGMRRGTFPSNYVKMND